MSCFDPDTLLRAIASLAIFVTVWFAVYVVVRHL